MTNSAPDTDGTQAVNVGPYQIFMLALCLLVLATLAVQTFFKLDTETRTLLDYADTGICVIFMADFVITLMRSENKLHYLLTWGWIDFISSIPVGALRLGRTMRVIRILRLMRMVRSTRMLASYVLERRAEGTFLAAALTSILLVVSASIAILHVERVEQANIRSADDAIWWAFTTITTVGYGDKYPVTGEGRVIACVLMTTGVGLFGVFTGFIASWFISPKEAEQTKELEEVLRELRELKKLLQKGRW